MQYEPQAEALLNAIADFLQNDVRPALDDKRLSFRALIAANLARIVAGEMMAEEGFDAAELGRLRALLRDGAKGGGGAEPLPEGRSARRAAIRRANAELSGLIRDAEELDPAWEAEVRDHLKQALIEKLMVSNPRFDGRMEIE